MPLNRELQMDGLIAVSQLLYPESTAPKCLFPQEKGTLRETKKGTRIVKPL
jgi:hypothetical protein